MEITIAELRELLAMALQHIADLYASETERTIEIKALVDAGESFGPQFEKLYRAYLDGEAANSFRDRRSFVPVEIDEALLLLKR